MVKNTFGGSGHKSQARKFATNGKMMNFKTRFSVDEYEYYAQVSATLGNGMCHVICKDGKKRLCFIRGKFRGRGKHDNTVIKGSWVLVGGRSYESEKSGEGKDLEKCDLLEVYSDIDKEKLKDVHDFSEFVERDALFSNVSAELGDNITFSKNTCEEDYHTIMSYSMKKECDNKEEEEEDDEINVDDI
jgi:translation initiation factor IF-1